MAKYRVNFRASYAPIHGGISGNTQGGYMLVYADSKEQAKETFLKQLHRRAKQQEVTLTGLSYDTPYITKQK